MRSLTFKLVLAFLVASVAGIILASIFIRQLVLREFDDYVTAQRREEFVSIVSSYYAAHGSWDGVGAWLRDQMLPARPPVEGPGETQGPLVRLGGPLQFLLADSDGAVVAPLEAARFEVRLSKEQLANGTPLVVGGQVVGTVLGIDRPNVRNLAEERYLERTDRALAIAAAGAVLIALVLGVFLARLLTRPVRELTAAAQGIAGGELEQRVPVRSQDELGLLAAQFNRMSADLSRATRARRQMTADIAHDLRTPLTVIAGYLEALRDQVLQPTPERFATMYAEIQLLLRLVEDLHTISLADAGELALAPQRIEPRVLLERVAEAYRHTAEQRGIALVVRAEEEVAETCVDPERMVRALGNLVSNALNHTPQGGRVELSVRRAAGGVELAVADTGTGIAPEHLPHIFERFYRPDSSRSQQTGGSGLGLAIVRSIVEAHGGSVRAESAQGCGATFTITLPSTG